jgi:prepilin-type N-terminal cleavage/methylation domain-containing protein
MAREQGRAAATDGERGFSLVELMVAMTVTLIITGAVFQLVSAGQSSFRREPALADRQQNIRMGIDLITRDLYRAGFGLPEFAQVFTRDLDGAGPAGSGGEDSDILELVAASDCPTLQVCDVNGSQLTTFAELSECYALPSMVILANSQEWHPMWAEKPGGGASASCVSGGGGGATKNGHVAFPSGKSDLNPSGGPSKIFTNPPEWMLLGQVIRYRIALEADGTPNLERSGFGGQDYPDGTTSWELVARGVEDLQVDYENGLGWFDDPGATSCGANCGTPGQTEYDTLTRRVRVRLSARVVGEDNLTGQTTSAVGNGVRGQLVTEVAPRTALASLGMFEGEL